MVECVARWAERLTEYAMNSLSIVFFTVALLILLLSLRKQSDILSPARIFCFVWAFALGCTELKLSALQHLWSWESWVTILLGIGGFLAGSFLSYVQNIDQRLMAISEMRDGLRQTSILEHRLFVLILLAFGVYLVSYGVVYFVRGFIPLFSIKGVLSRTEFQVFAFGLLLHSIVFILYFTVLYHVLVPRQRGKKLALNAVCLVTSITFLLILQRFQFVLAAVMSMTFIYYATHHLRLRNTLIYLCLIVAFVYLVSTLRTGQLLQAYLYTGAKMKFGPQYAPFTEPYMYVVMSLENLATAIDRLESFTYGYYSLDFLTALTGIKHWVREYFALETTPYLNSSYNNYSSFWPYYRDFGALGLAGIELVLGWGIGQIYYGMRRSPSLQNVTAYSAVVFLLLMSFFLNALAFLWFVYNMVMLVVILELVTVKQVNRSRRSFEELQYSG
jgi:oligosaccharide repeat unit polymerase